MAGFKYIRRRLSEKLELPEDALGAASRVQIMGSCAILSGCKKLLKYKSEEIVALTKDSVVVFTGCGLKCLYFFEGTIEICGEICNVGFEKR